MATGDFAWLKLQLANMAGRTAVAELDFDATLAGQCINEAYLDCYVPQGNGTRRPGWAMQTKGLQFEAPVTATIGVTLGSKTFTGYSPAAVKVGSIVQVGQNYYTYAGQIGAGSVADPDLIPQGGTVALVAGQQSYDIVFDTPFDDWPEFFTIELVMASSSAEIFTISRDGSTQSGDGVTVWLTGIPTSASAGSYLQWSATGEAGPTPSVGAHQFVEPIMEPTGNYEATFYHNSYVMDAASIELQGGPMVIGWGLLRPMNGRIEAAKWRQITFGDFWGPQPFGAGLMTTINWPGGVSNPTGTPIWYYVDNSALEATNAIACRMVIWPIPLQITTVQYQGWIMPVELSDDADLPILPANLVTRCLVPLARERWVMTYKKYTGQNQDYIMREAERARGILALTSQGQRDRPVRLAMRNC